MDEDYTFSDNDAGYTLGGSYDTSDYQPTGDAVNLEGGDLGELPPNLEGGDLGQTEAQAQDDFYRSIGIDPSTVTDTTPETTARINEIISGAAYKADPDLVKTLAGYFKKTVGGKQVTDWDKVGLVGGLLAKATGLTKPETPGYKGSIKEFAAVNAPINYNDPNRRPGSMGRQYFTPTQFVPAGGDVAGAQAAANQQAQGILANYTPAEEVTPKWNAQNAVATPWARRAPPSGLAGLFGGNTAGITGMATGAGMPASFSDEQLHALDKMGYGNLANIARTPSVVRPIDAPEVNQNQGPVADSNESYAPAFTGPLYAEETNGPPADLVATRAAQGGIMAAKGRYLRGNTDGMADKINTSIDDRQPAKLSHGEFVVPADVVSHLGNGNSDAGAKKLYQMMDKIRIARTGTKKQGRQINPDKYMPGGSVGYSEGGIAAAMPTRFATGGPAQNTSTAGNLSEWAGNAITTNIGQGLAAANQPYQAYTGPLTAGASDLQQQQFAGISNIAQTGLTPTQYQTGTFDTMQANKYMNPYLDAALQPQLAEMRRQSQINLQPNLAKMTQAGGFGGGRQALMEAEANRNLQTQQNQAIGTGYASAFDKAMAQFNAEQNRGLQTQQAQQAANEASAAFGLRSLDALGAAGKTQRDIESEGIAADKSQFEEARDWDKKMAQYKQGLFSGMPVATQVNTANQNPITELLTSSKGIAELLNRFSTS